MTTERRNIAAEVTQAHKIHPDWNVSQIAKFLGTTTTNVCSVAFKKNLPIPPTPKFQKRAQTTISLDCAEMDLIRARAHFLGLSLSAYFRKQALAGVVA